MTGWRHDFHLHPELGFDEHRTSSKVADPLKVKTVYTGLELNMGFYSRNREINPNSSFSVNG